MKIQSRLLTATPWLVVTLAVTTSALSSAQASMKTGDSGGGGIPKGSVPLSVCKASRTDGKAGPAARVAWKVTQPGFISYCVAAIWERPLGTNSSASTTSTSAQQTSSLRSTAMPTVKPMTLTVGLLDVRMWPEYPYDSQLGGENKQSPAPSHTRRSYRSATLSEPLAPSTTAALSNAWCESNIKWSSRPFLRITTSGPALRGRTQPGESDCIVEFGTAARSQADLEQEVGAPAFPARIAANGTATRIQPSHADAKK